MKLSHKMGLPWKIEFYLTSAGTVWISRIAIEKLLDCISVNDLPLGIGTNAMALRVPDVPNPEPQIN